MKYLLLDTSNSFINIYVIENDKLLVEEHIKVLKDMSNIIMPKIREIFDNLSFELRDIDKLFVTIGPGSFTGVRIGITVIKTIGYSLNIPVYPISTLEYLSSITTKKNRIISIIDARRGNVFAGYYDNTLNKLKEEALIPYDSIEISDDDIIVSYDGVYNSEIMDVDVIKLINKHQNDNSINPHELVPNYLKKTEAEEKLND